MPPVQDVETLEDCAEETDSSPEDISVVFETIKKGKFYFKIEDEKIGPTPGTGERIYTKNLLKETIRLLCDIYEKEKIYSAHSNLVSTEPLELVSYSIETILSGIKVKRRNSKNPKKYYRGRDIGLTFKINNGSVGVEVHYRNAPGEKNVFYESLNREIVDRRLSTQLNDKMKPIR